MKTYNKFKCILLSILFGGSMLLLGGCNAALLDPKGTIALKEMHLLVGSTLLMLIVVIPVILMSFFFAWRYRASNRKAKYNPHWEHSNLLELICWTIPIIIITILATVTWVSTHRLDPFRPLDAKSKPLIIQVVALNWKWLFIYPEQRIATVNFVQMPVNVPVRFQITSDAPMNSFLIPRLAGQIYAMAGMRTKLNLIATEVGDYRGISANYSGDGFSGMHFVARVSSQQDFNKWLNKAKQMPNSLTLTEYNKLVEPSEYNRVEYFSSVKKGLFNQIIMKYMRPDSHIIEGNVKQEVKL